MKKVYNSEIACNGVHFSCVVGEGSVLPRWRVLFLYSSSFFRIFCSYFFVLIVLFLFFCSYFLVSFFPFFLLLFLVFWILTFFHRVLAHVKF